MSARLPIGARRHFVTLLAPVETTDDNGGLQRSFLHVESFWARVAPRAQAMIFRNDQQGRAITHDVYFRSRSGVTAEMRFLLDGRLLQILSFDDFDERGVISRAQCEEILS